MLFNIFRRRRRPVFNGAERRRHGESWKQLQAKKREDLLKSWKRFFEFYGQ